MARPINHPAREAQRRAILKAAGRLFAQRGFHQTGMAAICKAVGMSPGALYRYFDSKAALIEGIVALERADSLCFLDSVNAEDSLHDGILEALIASLRLSVKPEAVALSLEVAAEAARNPAVEALCDEAYRVFVDRLEGMIRAAQALGTVSPDTQPHTAALVLTSAFDGLTINPAGAATIESQAMRHTLESLVAGVLGPRPT